MKKSFALLVLTFITLNVFAQKPEKGAMGFTFGLSGLQNIGVNAGTSGTGSTLLFRYYVADGMAGRLGVNFASSNTKTPSVVSGDSLSVSSGGWGLSLGIQKSLGDNEKLEPYVGADLSLRGTSGKSTTTSKDPNGTSVVEVKNGSGFSFGLTPLIGVNWFVLDGLALGAEFGWGFSMSSTGEGTSTSTYTPTSGSATVTTMKTPKTSSTSIGGSAHGMITASIFFNP